jgi:TonB family protein
LTSAFVPFHVSSCESALAFSNDRHADVRFRADATTVVGSAAGARRTPNACVIGSRNGESDNLATPKPEYPIEARRRHLTGKGIYQLTISENTGEVLSVDVITSAGYPILDRAAVKTLKLWKFRPHAVTRAKVPITFSMPAHTDNKEKP